MRRNKYNAKKTIVDGITFDSAAEARRYAQLKLLEKCRAISDLTRQVPFEFRFDDGRTINTPSGRVMKYVADFAYTDKRGVRHIEDVKGVMTELSALKIKLTEALYGIRVEVVR